MSVWKPGFIVQKDTRTSMLIKLPIFVSLGLYIFSSAGFGLSNHTFPIADRIKLPSGFKISVFVSNVNGARSLALGTRGTIFVGTRETGLVYAIRTDTTKNFRPLETIVIASGLHMPNGVAFRDGSLYVAEVERISRFDHIEDNLKAPKKVIVYDSLPTKEAHGWKFIGFGPDGYLYIPIGGPCNSCESEDKRFGTLIKIKPNGQDSTLVAKGVRNSVGFDWDPDTHDLWFTDNGRDWLGDNSPPDELNHLSHSGEDFGFPYCYGKSVVDPDLGKKDSCVRSKQPEIELGPHVASLGMRFYSGKMFPDSYKGQIFIAEHGSWNRTQPIGYRLSLVKLKNHKPVSYETFADGWLQGTRVFGRPVDLMELPDGSMLVSDDFAGVLYRIIYTL